MISGIDPMYAVREGMSYSHVIPASQTSRTPRDCANSPGSMTDHERVDMPKVAPHESAKASLDAPRCIWPNCSWVVSTFAPETKLCGPHLGLVVYDYKTAVEAREAAQAEMAPKPEAVVGTIYFIQVGGHIKIGWTSDMTKRMRAYPPNTTLLAAHPGERKDELRLHKMFAVHRSHGREWYPLAPVILEHIKRVVAEHGVPDAVDFGAKPTEVPQP